MITATSGKNIVVFPAKDPDPITFQGLRLPADVTLTLPSVIINGDLVYSHSTGSYLCDNLVFDYGDGKDIILGSIQWKKDKGYETNGKSEYVFHLVFLDATISASKEGEPVIYKEEQELTLNADMPSLYGIMRYEDTGPREIIDGETVINPTDSKVTYSLHTNRLRPRQLHTFLRVWLLMSGPVNDE